MGNSRVSACFRFACPILLLAPAFGSAIQGLGASQLASTMVLEDKAVTMLAPRTIGDNVVNVEWSPGGKYVVFSQTSRIMIADVASAVAGKPITNPERFANSQVMAWNRATGKAVRLTTIPRPERFYGEWFADDETLVRTEEVDTESTDPRDQSWRVTLFNAGTGTSKSIVFNRIGAPIGFEASASSPTMAVLFRQPGGGGVVALIDTNGNVRSRFAIPNQLESLGWLMWLRDGTTLVTYVQDLSNSKKRQVLFVDTKSGETRIGEPSKDIDVQIPPDRFPQLQAMLVQQPTYIGSESKINVAILTAAASEQLATAPMSDTGVPPTIKPFPKTRDTTEPTTAFIAADVQQAHVSPKSDAVLYVQNGVALVRDIAYLPLVAYKQMKEAAQRAEVVNRAKQMGLGMLMYAADYDDVLPASFDPNAIAPYLKNNQIMDGFVYTFGGGDLGKFDGPLASTEMGYVPGPGGRAVVYLDGHVKWVADPKPPLTFVKSDQRTSNLEFDQGLVTR